MLKKLPPLPANHAARTGLCSVSSWRSAGRSNGVANLASFSPTWTNGADDSGGDGAERQRTGPAPQQQADAGEGDERADADRRPGEQCGEGEAGGEEQGAAGGDAPQRQHLPGRGDAQHGRPHLRLVVHADPPAEEQRG